MPSRARKTGYFMETQAHSYKMPSMHHHDLYELYFLHEGNREYFVEDSFFSVCAGSFVLIAPGKLHRTGGTYALRTLVMFSEEYLQSIFSSQACDSLLQCFDRLHITPPEEQLPALRSLLKAMEDCTDKVEFGVHLGNLLCALSHCPEETDCHPGISRIIRYINQNYDQIRNIDDIAQGCFLSKYYLCHSFRKHMGITVIDYLNQVRIKTACARLVTESLSVQDLAADCGYSSAAYFCTVFKNHTGLSPSEYRNKGK